MSIAVIAKLVKNQPEQRAARVAGVMYAEVEYMQRARIGCSKARFDYTGIEERLRASAEASHALQYSRTRTVCVGSSSLSTSRCVRFI